MMIGRKTERAADAPSALFPMAVLVATMGASTWLNIVHSLSTHPAGTAWRNEMAVMAAIPPLLVPVLIELLGREARRGAQSPALFRSAFGVTVLLTLAAFGVSVWSIASLGIAMGLPQPVAAAFPIILDLAAASATIFLLDRALSSQHDAYLSVDAADEDTPAAVSPAPTPTLDYPLLDPASRWATVTTGDIPVITADIPEPVAVVQRTATDVARELSPAPVATPPVALSADLSDSADSPASDIPADTDMGDMADDSDTATDADIAPAPTATPPADTAVGSTADIPDDALDIARAVVAATGIKAGAHDVAAVITALGRGDALAVIARETGVHRTTVRKVRDHLADTSAGSSRRLTAVS